MTAPGKRIRGVEPASANTIAFSDNWRRFYAENGCARLLDRTETLYAREAQRFGVSVEAIRIALNYSADEIRRMMAVGL